MHHKILYSVKKNKKMFGYVEVLQKLSERMIILNVYFNANLFMSVDVWRLHHEQAYQNMSEHVIQKGFTVIYGLHLQSIWYTREISHRPKKHNLLTNAQFQ